MREEMLQEIDDAFIWTKLYMSMISCFKQTLPCHLIFSKTYNNSHCVPSLIIIAFKLVIDYGLTST